jgi:hypothetical protein
MNVCLWGIAFEGAIRQEHRLRGANTDVVDGQSLLLGFAVEGDVQFNLIVENTVASDLLAGLHSVVVESDHCNSAVKEANGRVAAGAVCESVNGFD